jgi:hypothetical protein
VSNPAGVPSIASWLPLFVASGGLLTAFVTGFSRRDQKQRDYTTTIDARTNTAIKGLTEAYDRLEVERARIEQERDEWRERAVSAEEELAAFKKRRSRRGES